MTIPNRSVQLYMGHIEPLERKQAHDVLAGYLTKVEFLKNGIFRGDLDGEKVVVAVSHKVLLSTSRLILERFEARKQCNLQPVVFSWALEPACSLVPRLNQESLGGLNLALRGIVARDKKGDDFIDFDITNYTTRKHFLPLVEGILCGDAFKNYCILTIDLMVIKEQSVRSMMIDWDGRAVVEVVGEADAIQAVINAIETYRSIGVDMNFKVEPFSRSLMEKNDFKAELIEVFGSASWSRQLDSGIEHCR